MFQVAIDGGMEKPIETDWGSSGSYSEDGTKLAFTRHPSVWSRKHYRGSWAADLWVEEVATKKFTKLADPDYKGNYLWPMYGRNGDIYFVSDEMPNEKSVRWGSPEIYQSTNNIWKISEKGGKAVQLTHHTSGNLYFPSISADGKTIVYEENFGMWKLDTGTGKSNEIRVDIKSDVKESEVELKTITSEAEGFNLSPSSRRAAISTHGEIFTIATEKGEVQRVSDTPWREENPRWSPNGKWIAFVSDRTGREELWIADEMGRNLKKLTDVDCDKPAIVWAPDSKSLLWSGSDHKLRHVVVDNGKTEVIATGAAGNVQGPQFSPDGKWVSYSKQDVLLKSHVYVKPLDSGTEREIGSDDFLVASGAKWTPDGRKLLLLGGVGAPGMSALNRTVLQLYSVSLTRNEKNPDDHDVDTEAQAEAAATETMRRSGGAAVPKVEVKIEWDGLDQRIRQLTHLGGSVMDVVPAPDSRSYAIVVGGGAEDGPGLYVIGDDAVRVTRISTALEGGGGGRGRGGAGGGGGGFDPQWSKDGRSIYYMQGGGIYSAAAPAAPAGDTTAPVNGGGRGGRGAAATPAAGAANTAPRRIAFTVRLEVDNEAERRQVFEEGWRVMKNRFYDRNMHGVNWAAAKDTYESLLPNIVDNDELHVVMMQMIGELNASHTGVTGGGAAAADRIQTHYPGFDLAPDASGFYKVTHIYRKGPADHDYVKISSGNYIVAVNGRELKTPDNYWKLFNLLPGRKFDFTVNSKPQLDGAWTVSLEPLTQQAMGNLEYDRWVDEHRAMVEKASNGEIGYLHIRAMDAPSLERFQRDLIDNRAKKALIIDERFNGGGGIDQELLEILNQRKKYESYRSRDSVEVPRPVQAFFGPMVVLENERSASNAEMFPEGFKTLGLGKVIGVNTMGAVIGTGSYRLMDGATIRTPGVGVYTANGTDFENYGVPPDIYVDNAPSDFLSGHDRQIEKAVEVLRSEMK
jgi:tricorn protease